MSQNSSRSRRTIYGAHGIISRNMKILLKPREMIQRFREARRQNDESSLLRELPTLLKHGWHVDTADPAGRTAMMWAGAMGFYDVVRWLLNAGANPERVDRRGWSTLRYTLMRRSPMPNDLLERLVTPRTITPTLPFGWTALMVSASNGCLQTVARLHRFWDGRATYFNNRQMERDAVGGTDWAYGVLA